jgi:hypothetical protein
MLDNCRVDQGLRTFLTLECESPHPEGRTDGAGGTVWLDSCCRVTVGWTNIQGGRRLHQGWRRITIPHHRYPDVQG